MFEQTELDALYRYALSLSGDADEAYDLLYNNVERLLRNRDRQPRIIDNKMAFMRRCIRNSFLDLQRHTQVRLVKNEHLEREYETRHQELESLEECHIRSEEVSALLKSLSTEERELLYLWAVEDYTAQEISQLQGGGRGTWLSRLHRIRKKLRKKVSCSPFPLTEDQQ